MDKIHITTPIYYVNGDPHVGHAYTTILGDILSRFYKVAGYETFFTVGTDEHGEKMLEAAVKANIDPQKYVDQNSKKFQDSWDLLNIDYSVFLRTSEPSYSKKVQTALQILFDKDYIYKGKFEGFYCVGCEQYKTERDLVDGLCPDHQKKPILKKEENYMFKLSHFEKELKKRIEQGDLNIVPEEKKNSVLAFYGEGLKDISFSRKKLSWGVTLPWDEEHVAYVWPEAFLNYLLSTGWDGEENQDSPLFPPDIQLMSKDIIRVHATIWPAMLLGLDLDTPKNMLVHGFFTVDGKKMSKSVGNVVSPSDLVDRYGVDGTRYLLSTATSIGNDGDISFSAFDVKYNADLANGLGNLVSRVFALTRAKGIAGELTIQDEVEKKRVALVNAFEKHITNYSILDAANAINEFITELNRYINDSKPWETNSQSSIQVIKDCLVSLETIALLYWPIMPKTSEDILDSYSIDNTKNLFEKIKLTKRKTKINLLKSKRILFPRLSRLVG